MFPYHRFDFFLVSSSARQGTASPCYYTIVSENGGLDMNKLQILTYKLCHMYFNWSGSVAVPAPFQYAKKLAALQAVVYENPAHSHMHELLYYL
jgi:aubergine-like protein